MFVPAFLEHSARQSSVIFHSSGVLSCDLRSVDHRVNSAIPISVALAGERALGFLTGLTVTKWFRLLLSNMIGIILNFLIVAAYNLTHILHSFVRHFYSISVDDTSQDVVFRKVVNDLEKIFSNVFFNVAGEGWIKPLKETETDRERGREKSYRDQAGSDRNLKPSKTVFEKIKKKRIL